MPFLNKRQHISFVYFSINYTFYLRKDGVTMNTPKNIYDDDNIPKTDLPTGKNQTSSVEPLPESTRPRKDGPGGDDGE